MLEITNRSYCFAWDNPLTFPLFPTNTNIAISSNKFPDYSLLFTSKKAESNLLDQPFNHLFYEKSFKQLSKNNWLVKKTQELIRKANLLNDEEISYPIYEILGVEYWKIKDFNQAFFWLQEGIKKGEPICMELLENLKEFSKLNNINELGIALRKGTNERIHKLQKIDKPKDYHKLTLKRLETWIKEYDRQKRFKENSDLLNILSIIKVLFGHP